MFGRTLALALAVAGLIAGSLSGPAAAAQPPRATLQAFACQPSPNQLSRAIAVTAVMRHVPATKRMQLRFVLLRKLADQSWFSSVHGRGLGNWLSPPNPTLGQIPGDTWKVNKRVINLPGPAVYRLRVTFRWLGSSGVIGTRARLTPLCTQPW